MKKTFLLAIALVSFFMVSCGSEIENDVAKLADIQCQMMGLEEKFKSGDADAMKEVKELQEKMMTMAAEFKDKYTTEEDQKKFAAAIEEAIKNQDCGK
ncbi:hypothetical protein [uncultured Kordia sp.]|uniref:hypothetical protein n=1 Tax=uncultured Kordia sp. TaxID=507699 RepID=UPI00260892E6|nr:hypothetical protein [uncultured Kordia sp.]